MGGGDGFSLKNMTVVKNTLFLNNHECTVILVDNTKLNFCFSFSRKNLFILPSLDLLTISKINDNVSITVQHKKIKLKNLVKILESLICLYDLKTQKISFKRPGKDILDLLGNAYFIYNYEIQSFFLEHSSLQ